MSAPAANPGKARQPVDLTHFNLPKAGGVAHHQHPDYGRKVHTGFIGPNGGMLLRDPHNHGHHAEDRALYDAGVLDMGSLLSGYQEQADPIQILVHDKQGRIKHIRRTHNLRINYGGSLLLKMLLSAFSTAAGTGLNAYLCTQATIAYAATTVTPGTSPAWVVNAYQDCLLVTLAAAAKVGVIISNTATVATVDQWYTLTAGTVTNPMTATVAANPAANTPFLIVPAGFPLLWLALSNDATAPNTTDTTLAGEVTTNGMARQFAVPSVTTAPSGSSTSVNQTAAAKLHGSWTASGTVASIQKSGLLNVSTGGNPSFEGVFTLFGVNSGDTVAEDWTVTTT